MQLQIDVINHRKNKTVFQNREDNFEEVYFLNGNIYPLSTLGKKKKNIYISAVGPENHLENIRKGPYPIFDTVCLCMCECTCILVYL